MPKQVVIFQHVPSEKAGTILKYLEQNNIPFRVVDLFEKGAVWPPPESASALVVMGGPMNVYDEDKFPFLKEENRYIQEAVRREVPFLGICLGSQLLAKALGAKVYRAAQEEIGWQEVELTSQAAQDKLFSSLGPGKLKVLQWHGDTFDLPQGAVRLASSPVVTNQAYEVRGRFYGLQFHVEVDRPMLEEWFRNREDLKEILSEYDAYKPRLSRITDRLYREFFSLA